jgi:3-phenylpropionate/trans-cinnamate dioxygenase ferredoxin subunit
MTATRSGFVTGLSASEVEPGTVRFVQVAGRSVCVGHTEDGEWGAIDNVCTHDGGVLGDGELDGEAVECPRHGGRFDLFSGRVLALPPVRPVSAYAVHVEDGEIVVDLP